ncbi:hypothetical protein SynMINOS11_01151 [Synechococcus sp. Minos11]|nr:hypothetical protein SynMINOS11_01151 [Synechococcus sp. Minos11]
MASSCLGIGVVGFLVCLNRPPNKLGLFQQKTPRSGGR